MAITMSGLGYPQESPANAPSTGEAQTQDDRPEPKVHASAEYSAVPVDESQNDGKADEEGGAPTQPRRGCWEAIQDWTWTLELLSLVFAIASTIAICIILWLWDDRPLRDWPLPIQPNSLVSVFSTLAKTALMLPVGSVISQMKWIWFEEPRRLNDLQTFESASRGPWGSLRLIWTTRGKAWITKAACVVTVAALAFEPTAQQVLSFETRDTVSGNATASLSVATNWTSASLMLGEESFYKQVETQGILLSAFSARAQNNSVPQFECNAPTCRWENVETLGACSVCDGGPRPASTLMRNGSWEFFAGAPINFTVGPALPDGGSKFPTLELQPRTDRFVMEAPNGMDMPDYSFMKFAAINYTDARNAATDGTSGWVWEKDASLDYYLCRIHACVQTFPEVTVSNGVYQAGEPTKKWLLPDPVVPTTQDPTIKYRTEEEDGAGSAPEDWTVDFGTAQRINAVLGNLMTGSMTRTPRGLEFWRQGGITFGVTQYILDHGPGGVLANFAAILSAQMRNADNAAARDLSGIAFAPQTFIVVNWAWMAGPLGLLAITAATLALAVVRNASRPLGYKESAVALLSLGIGHLGADGGQFRGNPLGQRYSANQAEAVAEGMAAKLHRGADGEYMFVKC
ncbi:hypothetical protein PG985_014933 [Apiospora marii]|uniref:Carboxylic ester hydrolase n=1 Tax=Apiospora marii TaxID=335849 RepID=A0ABR1RJ27_9PEZI